MSGTQNVLSKLPAVVYVDNPRNAAGCPFYVNCDAQVIAIKRGERGFFPIYTPLTAAHLNAPLNVTPAQLEAMRLGSMFGFDSPCANPDNYDAKGKWLKWVK